MFNSDLMEEICERENLLMALKRVVKNNGAPGIDNEQAKDLQDYLRSTG